ncbi:MAG: hypothetical protein ACLVCH_10690 [Roseburia inulinivorans]
MDEMVLEVQVWLNKTYNVGVVEDRNTVSEQLVETTQAGIGIDKCIWFQ